MSETVALALITASAGLVGAVVGGVAAVVGPWWLRRSERSATTRAEAHEAMRDSLVRWGQTQIEVANAMDAGRGAALGKAAGEANAALIELVSRIAGADAAERAFVKQSTASLALYADNDLRRAAASRAVETMLTRHSGALDELPMTPYALIPGDPRDPAMVVALDFNTWGAARQALAAQLAQ